MGSMATLKSGLYQSRLASVGFESVLPSDEEIDQFCTCSIRLVKANLIAEAYEPAAECVRRLTDRGAIAVVLACTELPLAIPHERRPSFRIELTDSTDGHACAAIHWYRGQLTAP
jgi:aspartate racemase